MDHTPQPTSHEDDKHALRRLVREQLAALTDAQRHAASPAICTHALALPALADARCVLTYLPMPAEVDVDPIALALTRRGVRLAAPRLDWDTNTMQAIEVPTWPPAIERRRFNVPEPPNAPPIAPDPIDAVIVPGLAFDATGRRLGRGAGFYDRFFATLPATTRRIGVCFHAQVVQRVPVDKHDVPVHAVVSERGAIMCDSPA